ncbi:MAG TPA: molecular chaperone DnaJ [Rhodospirillales bacterium]|nr:molecular chaperone DnaJ [Rhodospirillales bacterium]
MLPYLALGVALMAGLLLAGRWFAAANPQDMVKGLKWLLIGVFVLVLVFFTVTGRLAWALAALPALIPMLLRLRTAWVAARNFTRMAQSMSGGGGTKSGQTSDVETRFLRMILDHDSGAISGHVISGTFSGRTLESMSLEELLQLLNECDKPSVKVLEAYLDRVHEDWREKKTTSAFEDSAMSRGEAWRILDLEPGAKADEIKEAHRRLIAGLHPDRGGSTYLAAKINQAKDLLLS